LIPLAHFSKTSMELSVSVPFPSTREAEIVLKTLQVDPEPKRSQLVRTMRVEGSDLLVTFACSEPATLRVSVGSFFDLLTLAVKTIQRFD